MGPSDRVSVCLRVLFSEKHMTLVPLPRLITSFSSRRGAPISHFVNGLFRIAVGLMVMAAEDYFSFSVGAFEELTST